MADVTGGSNEDAVCKLISNDKMVAAAEAKQAAKLPFRSVSAPDLAIFGFASLVTKSPLEMEDEDHKGKRRTLGDLLGFKAGWEDQPARTGDISFARLTW